MRSERAPSKQPCGYKKSNQEDEIGTARMFAQLDSRGRQERGSFIALESPILCEQSLMEGAT